MFKLEIKDEAEAKALDSQNLTQTFQPFGRNIKSKTKNLSCGESHHCKGCANRKGPHVASYIGAQHTKNKHSDNMWWTIKNDMLTFYSKTRLPLSPRIRHSHFQLNNW